MIAMGHVGAYAARQGVTLGAVAPAPHEGSSSPRPHPANFVFCENRQRAPVSLRTKYLWCTPTKAIQNPLLSANAPRRAFSCLLPASLRESGARRVAPPRTPPRYLIVAVAVALYPCYCRIYVARCAAALSVFHIIVLQQPPKQRQYGTTVYGTR